MLRRNMRTARCAAEYAPSVEEAHEHSPCRQGSVGRSAGQGSLRNRRDSAARSCAEVDVRLGRPQGAARAAGRVDADRGRADLDARQPRRARPRDGGGRQLQRRLGGARRADLAARRAQESLSHRRLRRLGHRLGGRLQGQALEGRRRGRRPLQPGRRRRRGMQRRRPDVLALAAHLGLRDAGRLLRPVLPRAGPPADGAAEAPDLGGGRLLHADAGDRLPHAVRPRAAPAEAGRQRAGLGRLGRPRRVRRPALRRRRRQRDRRHLRRNASATT